ncbi:MAG: hypothetical protein ACU0CO_06490, partial [Shimia sp.]
ARAVAVGSSDAAEAEARMREVLTRGEDEDTVHAVEVSRDGEYVVASIDVAFADVMFFGGFFTGDARLEGWSIMMAEEAFDAGDEA